MLSQESISKISKPLLVTGFVLDGIHKLSAVYHILPPNILGKGTLVENHIGNFGTSAILTSFVRNKVLDNMTVFDRLEKKKGEEYANRLKNSLTFASVALLYIAWEGMLPFLARASNPEMIGDITVALSSSLLYLASYPKHRNRIFF